MKNRKVLIRYDEKERRWKIGDRTFATLEDAGAAAREIMAPPGTETVEALMRASTCRAPIART